MCFIRIDRLQYKLLWTSAFFFLVVFLYSKLFYRSVHDLTEQYKCPACYGTSFCEHISSKRVNIHSFNSHTLLANLFPLKNVYFGDFYNNKVVFKKLAHSEELKAFDRMICAQSLDCCTSGNKRNNILGNNDYLTKALVDVSSNFIDNDKSGLIICPNPKKSHFFDKLLTDPRHFNAINLWTLVRINPEPILLQILQAEEGWPVPKFYGCCGRVCVEEYIGDTLIYHRKDPWLIRAKISAELLKAAQMLTFRDSSYSYYLTDMSPDNIAVNGAYQPIFIDLEHVIVVHRNKSRDNLVYFKNLHQSEGIMGCRNCFAFSPEEICSRQISDHNYYAVCTHILSPKTSSTTIPGGFLFDVPKWITSLHPELRILIDQCSMPTGRRNRIQIGDELAGLLENIYGEFKSTL